MYNMDTKATMASLWCFVFLLTAAVHVRGLDRAEFSASLQRAVNDLLGSGQYQKHLEQIAPQFRKEILDGGTFTKMFADDINRKVIERAEIVRELKRIIVGAFNRDHRPEHEILKCCPEAPLNLKNDPRFAFPTNDEIICHYGYDPSPDPADRVTGMSDDLLEVMMRHHARIKSLKWQYYGNEHGTLYTYPAVGTCAVTNYDPRVRPWYSFAVSIPKDLVIMIDKSQSMATPVGSHDRLHYAITATQAVINSANPNDHMSVISFADEVDVSTDHPCYSTDLALMTPTNKDKLTAFAGTSISVASNIPANFSSAFKKAFSLLASSDSGEAREKGIMLLSAGLSSNTLAEINQTIIEGKRLAGNVRILAFGVSSDSSGTTLLKTISEGGMFKNLDYSVEDSDENIRKDVGEYNNHFTRPGDDQDVIFTQPYIGSQGLGLIISQCLSVFVRNNVKGVTCADMKVDTFFSEIVDFRLGQLSYSFFVDSRSRILIHPLLPRPDVFHKEPRFIDMESVEQSSETGAVKQTMLSGSSGSMNTSDLKISLRRGDSPLEGVSAELRSATYFWSPIQLMNATVAIVIVGDERNISLTWTTDFPPVLLTDELDVSDDQAHDTCNNFGRVAVKERSAVKLSLQSFKDSYYYTNDEVIRIPELKAYLQGDRPDQSPLAVKTGVREAVAMTYELEKIWKANAVDGKTALGYPIYRYVGTREGVFRVYPGIHLAKNFDPTQQPQYRRAEAVGNKISVLTATDSNSQVITSFAKAYANPRNGESTDSVILGVIGVDVSFSALYKFLTTQFDPCKSSSAECFAIDRSGLITIHKDFISNPPKSQMHITQKEPAIADNMVSVRSLIADSCVSYEDITNQLFWKANFTDDYVELSNCYVYTIDGLDMFVVVKKQSGAGKCTCSPIKGKDRRPKCTDSTCECPCYNATGYNYCSGRFTVTNSTKACYPGTLSLDLIDVSESDESVATSLPSCLDCALFDSESDCTTTGCCWSTDTCTSCEESSKFDSLFVALVIGISAGVVVLLVAVVIGVVCCCRRGGKSRCRDPQTTDAAPYSTTVVAVGKLSGHYSEIPAAYGPEPTTSNTTTDDNPDYLHPASSDPDYIHLPDSNQLTPL